MKSHWNYRVVRHPAGVGGALEDWFALHEVFYNNGMPTGMTGPITFVSDSVEDLAGSLEMAARDARARPVFDPPPKWLEPAADTLADVGGKDPD